MNIHYYRLLKMLDNSSKLQCTDDGNCKCLKSTRNTSTLSTYSWNPVYLQPLLETEITDIPDGLSLLSTRRSTLSPTFRIKEDFLEKFEEIANKNICKIIHDINYKAYLPKHQIYTQIPADYVDRQVVQHDKLMSKVLNCLTDIFILENISKVVLSKIIPVEETVDTSSNQKRYTNISTRYILLDCKHDFDLICSKTILPVHWFFYEDQCLKWKRSRGSIINVYSCLKHNNENHEMNQANRLEQIPCSMEYLSKLGHHIILTGLNGDGKSAELKKFFCDMITTTSDKMVLLLDARDMIKSISSRACLHNVLIYFITKFGATDEEKLVLEQCLKANYGTNAEIFVDVYGLGKSKLVILLKIFQIINLKMKSIRLWITCNKDVAFPIQDSLGIFQVCFEPFSLLNKLDFMRCIWSRSVEKTITPSQMFLEALKTNLVKAKTFNCTPIGDPVICYLWARLLLPFVVTSNQQDQMVANEFLHLKQISLEDLYKETLNSEFKDYIQDDSLDDLSVSKSHPFNVFHYAEFKKRLVQLHQIHSSFTAYFISAEILLFLKQGSRCCRMFELLKTLKANVVKNETYCTSQENESVFCFFKYPLVSEFLNRQLDLSSLQLLGNSVTLFEDQKEIKDFLLCCSYKNHFNLLQATFRNLHPNLFQCFTSYYISTSKVSADITNFLINQLALNKEIQTCYNDYKSIFYFILTRQNSEFLTALITFCSIFHVPNNVLEQFKISFESNFISDSNTISEKFLYHFICHILSRLFTNKQVLLFNETYNIKQELITIFSSDQPLFDKHERGNSFLHYITQQNITSSELDNFIHTVHPETLKALVNTRGHNEQTLLHLIVANLDPQKETIRAIKFAEADFTALDIYNESVLHTAIRCGRAKNTIEYLIETGADLTVLDEKGRSILYYATKHGNLDAIEVFSNHFNVNGNVDYLGNTLGHYAAKKPYAVHSLKKLISCGLDINMRNFKFETPLHVGVKVVNNLAMVKLLLNSETVNARNWWLETPLHRVVSGQLNNNEEYFKTIVKFLVINGANVNAVSMDLQTPLFMALKYNNTLLDISLLALFKDKLAINSQRIATKVLFNLVTTTCFSDINVKSITFECKEYDADLQTKDKYGNAFPSISKLRKCLAWNNFFNTDEYTMVYSGDFEIYSVCNICKSQTHQQML